MKLGSETAASLLIFRRAFPSSSVRYPTDEAAEPSAWLLGDADLLPGRFWC